jgi:hypothetical protein
MTQYRKHLSTDVTSKSKSKPGQHISDSVSEGARLSRADGAFRGAGMQIALLWPYSLLEH